MSKPTVPKRPGCSYCWCDCAAMSIAPFMFLNRPIGVSSNRLLLAVAILAPVPRAAQCHISLVLVPVAIGVFAAGGYSAGARLAFGAAGICAGVLATRRGALREPVVVVLLALAALGALSALWTIGPVDRTLRWGLGCGGYAGVGVAAAAVARRRKGVELVAGAVAAIAVGAGLAGVIAALVHAPPYAERIAGVWRPGGPFEYPPALALLEVSALSALLAAVGSRKRLVVAAGAAGLGVAGAVLVLAGSRLSLAMGIVVAGLWAAVRARVRLKAAVPVAVAIALLAGGFAFGLSGNNLLHGR